MYCDFSVSIDSIFIWVYEVQLVVIMECGLVCEHLEGLFPSQGIQVEDVHIDNFIKIVLRAKI